MEQKEIGKEIIISEILKLRRENQEKLSQIDDLNKLIEDFKTHNNILKQQEKENHQQYIFNEVKGSKQLEINNFKS